MTLTKIHSEVLTVTNCIHCLGKEYDINSRRQMIVNNEKSLTDISIHPSFFLHKQYNPESGDKPIISFISKTTMKKRTEKKHTVSPERT